MKPDPAVLRYLVTLVANVVRAGLSFVAGLIVARALGAGKYGDLIFLLGSFAAISQLLDMGSSTAFYTFLARRPRKTEFFVLYGVWLLLQFLLPALVIVVASPGFTLRVWQGHTSGIILLSWLSSFLSNQIWNSISQLGEAVRRTRLVQAALIVQAVLHTIAVSVFAYRGRLTLQTVLLLIAAEYILVAALFVPSLVRSNIEPTSSEESLRESLLAFGLYCRPLVVYAWVGFLYLFADRWLLQHFGGDVQQGYFGIGQQFATISLLATTSALRVFWKEVAAASEEQDTARVHYLYTRVADSLYMIAAWTTCLLLPYTQEILGWTVGSSYAGGSLTLALMFLYSIPQSLGQVQGTFFYATGDTTTYTRLGLLWMALSIPVTFILLAPSSYFIGGLGLGAIGLAIKLLVLAVLAVNVNGYVIARHNGWSLKVWDQVRVPLILGLIAYASKSMATVIIRGVTVPWPSVLAVGLGCLLYIPLSIVGLLSLVPSVRLASIELRRYVRAALVGQVPALAQVKS